MGLEHALVRDTFRSAFLTKAGVELIADAAELPLLQKRGMWVLSRLYKKPPIAPQVNTVFIEPRMDSDHHTPFL